MIGLKESETWFVAGSQHLYGPGPLSRNDAVEVRF
jgi:L-arabinose isomerase